MRRFHILVADDDDDDFQTIKEAFAQFENEPYFDHVIDGRQLLDFLGSSLIRNSALPDLILLDINMPKMDGIEALTHIKKIQKACDIPIIVYTTTNNKEQMKQCYLLGANGFVTKGVSFPMVVNFARDLSDFIAESLMFPGRLFRKPIKDKHVKSK
jgi:two-component system, response regulator